MTDIDITPCGKADLEDLKALSETTFRETFSDQNSEADLANYLAENFSLEKLTGEMDTPGTRFFLARVQGVPAAYLKLNTGDAQTEPDQEKGLEIQRIYVLQQFKGRRVGSALITKAVETARREGLDYIWLGVWENNHRAIGFYQTHGFVQFGEHEFLLGDDRQTDLLMKKDIR